MSSESKSHRAPETEPESESEPESDPTVQVAHQARFTTEGAVTTAGEVTATSLGDFGADVDGRNRDRESRLDRPEATEFGVDDRPEVERREEGEQASLFANVDRSQRTLTGEQASERFLFEADGQD